MENCNCAHCAQLSEVKEIAFQNFQTAIKYRLFFRVVFYGIGAILIILLAVMLLTTDKKQADAIQDAGQ